MIINRQGVNVGVVLRTHAAHVGVCTPTGQPIAEATIRPAVTTEMHVPAR